MNPRGNPATLTRKGKGRPPGAPNKRTLAQREWAEALLQSEEYRESARRRILAGRASHLEALFHEATCLPRKSEVHVTASEDLIARLQAGRARVAADESR